MKTVRKKRRRVRTVQWSVRETNLFEQHYHRVPLARLQQMIPNKTKFSIRSMAERYGWAVDTRKQVLSDEEKAWLVANWPEYGLALADAQRKLNVTLTVLRRTGKELGLPLSSSKRYFTENEKRRLSELLDQRYSVLRICDAFYYRSKTMLVSQIKKALFSVDKTKLHSTVRKLKCI